MPEQALSDVKVLDLTWYIAGPYCTKLMADHGADVIKVEKPGEGDPARRLGPFFKDEPHPEKSGLFLHLNTNKKSVTLNLKSATGKKIFKEMVEDADIVVENFEPRVMPSLGLDYETLERISPKLIMTSISNFGQTGPYRDYKASEVTVFGMGGPLWSTGIPDREPVKYYGNVIQYGVGCVAAGATMAALTCRTLQGIGQHVDLSIMESLASSINFSLTYHMGYQFTGDVAWRETPGVMGGGMSILPFGAYPCKDGYVFLLIAGEVWGKRLCQMMGMPDLLAERFPGAELYNLERKGEFDAIYMGWAMEHTKQEIFDLGGPLGVNLAPINTMEDVLKDRQLNERGTFVEIEHPVTGKLTYPGAPFKMMETPWQIRSPAPLLGQHNEEVYGKLGYDKENLVKLRGSGVI